MKTNPSHYLNGKIEPWDFIFDQQLDFFYGNVIKYICRAGFKDGESELDDIRKALTYLERKVYLLEQDLRDQTNIDNDNKNR